MLLRIPLPTDGRVGFYQGKHAGATLENIKQYHQVYAFYLQAQTGRERLNTAIGQLEGITCGEVAYNT
jgi:hypothetical protein